MLAGICTAVLFFTFAGCGPQAQPAIGNPSRGDTQLETKILDADEADAPVALPVQGECVKERFAHKTLPIYVNVDAAVQVPQEVCTPVYQVQRQLFTEADAKRIAAVLMGPQASERLVLSEENAPRWELLDETQRYLIGGKGFLYHRSDTPLVLFKEGSPRYSRSMTILPELQIDGLAYADAAEKADAIVESVTEGIGAYALREAYAVQYEERQWYELEYTRTVNGVPVALLYNAIANDTGEYETWEYERLWLTVDASGLMMMRWNGAMEITKTVSEQPALLPFALVMDCFRTMVLVKNSHYESEAQSVRTLDQDGSVAVGVPGNGFGEADVIARVSSVTLHITKIALSYVRVQSGSDYYLVPAWNFTGNIDVLDENGNPFYEDDQSLERPLLTINAIDGSVIDVAQGY